MVGKLEALAVDAVGDGQFDRGIALGPERLAGHVAAAQGPGFNLPIAQHLSDAAAVLLGICEGGEGNARNHAPVVLLACESRSGLDPLLVNAMIFNPPG